MSQLNLTMDETDMNRSDGSNDDNDHESSYAIQYDIDNDNINETSSSTSKLGTGKVTKKKYPRSTPIPTLKPDELYVDWGSLVNETNAASWIKQPLVNHILPLIEIDKMIGYATHLTTYHHPNTERKGDNCAANQEEKRFHNPLLGLPNIPFRPTLLKHLILDPSTKLTVSYIEEKIRHDADKGDDDGYDEEDDDDGDIVDDVDAHNGANDKIKKKRKKKLLAARATKRINWKKKDAKEKRDQFNFLYDRFHHSAAVAVGMLVEEMITASLLSLARQHVQRCRRLVSNDTNKNGGISEWTLPPEEAIINLYNDNESNQATSNMSSSLLTARVPTRSIVEGDNQHNEGEHGSTSYRNWCQSRLRNLKHYKNAIENDASYFQLLIPNIPSATPVVQQPLSNLEN